jgi:hypothetical protein
VLPPFYISTKQIIYGIASPWFQSLALLPLALRARVALGTSRLCRKRSITNRIGISIGYFDREAHYVIGIKHPDQNATEGIT